MAKYEDTRGISAKISSIFKNADTFLYIVSPYLKVPDDLMEYIQDRTDHSVKVIILYGKKDLTQSEAEKLYSIDGLEIRFKEKLHAKCYINERSALITSMNLYDFSLANNYEMGVSVERDIDFEAYTGILKDVDRMIRMSEPRYNSKTHPGNTSSAAFGTGPSSMQYQTNEEMGYCIRCAELIPLNPSQPYCSRCYKSWSRYWNPDYEERTGVCHVCGRSYTWASMNDPICDICTPAEERTSGLGSFLRNLLS